MDMSNLLDVYRAEVFSMMDDVPAAGVPATVREACKCFECQIIMHPIIFGLYLPPQTLMRHNKCSGFLSYVFIYQGISFQVENLTINFVQGIECFHTEMFFFIIFFNSFVSLSLKTCLRVYNCEEDYN